MPVDFTENERDILADAADHCLDLFRFLGRDGFAIPCRCVVMGMRILEGSGLCAMPTLWRT
jgi:hypothetical protein